MSDNENNQTILQVEQQVREELSKKYDRNMFGYINVFEERKKEILKNDYNIDFITTQENNNCSYID